MHNQEEKIAKKFKIVLAEKTNLQEAAEKSRNSWQNEQNQNDEAEQKIKEKLDRSASNARSGVEVGPPEMPGVHKPNTFSRKISISMFVSSCPGWVSYLGEGAFTTNFSITALS